MDSELSIDQDLAKHLLYIVKQALRFIFLGCLGKFRPAKVKHRLDIEIIKVGTYTGMDRTLTVLSV